MVQYQKKLGGTFKSFCFFASGPAPDQAKPPTSFGGVGRWTRVTFCGSQTSSNRKLGLEYVLPRAQFDTHPINTHRCIETQ